MIKLYDSRTHQKEDLKTIERGVVRMYVCGPTVYNYIHIGNARTFISFDMIRRYLEWRTYDVIYVSNITDVDDKIINKANEEGCDPADLAKRYTKAFIKDMHALGVKDPTIRPKATQEIPEMIEMIQRLIKKGHAYEADGDVYFSVRSLDSYGEVSGRNVDEMEAGHRELAADGIEDRKQDPLDFAIWKAAKPGEPAWDSPWGKGRPGWHSECAAMAKKYLGLPFDIHGGGADLQFPHHENETAQANAAWGRGFAQHWMHTGMLQINSEKMSKSLGNFVLLHDILKTTDPAVLRFLMLQTHYRSPLDFSNDRLAEAKTALGHIKKALDNIDWVGRHADGPQAALDASQVDNMIREFRLAFTIAMDDDFNSPKGLSTVFDYVGQVNTLLDGKQLGDADIEPVAKLRNVLIEVMDVLGIDILKYEDTPSCDDFPEEVVKLAKEITGYEGGDGQVCAQKLLEARQAARAAKDWAKADAIRDSLCELGYVIEDTAQGPRLTSK